MLKLFSWRRSIPPSIFTNLPSSPFNLIPRLLLHTPPSPQEDDNDPPFSLTKPKTLTKSKPPKPNSENAPVKSELPFDFMYSYSETSPGVDPIGFREPPRFSPFGPGRVDRKWTGTSAPVQEKPDLEKLAAERERVIGEPLSEEEVAELVEKYRHTNCSRQINLGKGGVTHNTLEDIHNHWRRAEAVRIKCLGVPTLDMDNICFHLEDKSGGKIIYRHINVLLIYRGRNYDHSNRPRVPVMLWKPLAPIYPKLVKNVADGLTFEETKEMRNRGLNSPPLMRLCSDYVVFIFLLNPGYAICKILICIMFVLRRFAARNGVYVNVVERVRAAFETEDVVRLDCTHVGTSDCKKIGVKLRDLVPCVPLLFKDEQIILWK